MGHRHRHGVYFERDDVVALAERPWLSQAAQRAATPDGVYLVRLARSVTLDLTRPWSETAQVLAAAPRMPPMTSAVLSAMVSAFGRLPWVATMHGFVVWGADLVGLGRGEEGATTFRLEPPGAWFEAWRDTRVRSAPGGRPWVLRGPRGRPVDEALAE